eukprot:1885990-Amphidinium_carterae.1
MWTDDGGQASLEMLPCAHKGCTSLVAGTTNNSNKRGFNMAFGLLGTNPACQCRLPPGVSVMANVISSFNFRSLNGGVLVDAKLQALAKLLVELLLVVLLLGDLCEHLNALLHQVLLDYMQDLLLPAMHKLISTFSPSISSSYLMLGGVLTDWINHVGHLVAILAQRSTQKLGQMGMPSFKHLSNCSRCHRGR